jgi:hypothetical protein
MLKLLSKQAYFIKSSRELREMHLESCEGLQVQREALKSDL